ncbi:hypothetical protein CR513_23570, partial [Mucuna pruriens]
MACTDMNKTNEEAVWFLDSGCSNQMCGKNEYFSNLDESYKDSVKLGNNSSMAVTGKGNIRLNMNDKTHIVTEVFFVPELKNNLLSIGQLQEKGLSILFQHGKCKVFHPENGLIMKTRISLNRMFMLHAIPQPTKSTCFHIVTKDIMHHWHYRYGHLSFRGLNMLQQKSMLVHADICGPIKPASNSKKSRKTWVYFLAEKSEIHVEKEANSLIRGLRTDRGGEFTLQEFTNFCCENGIQRQLTAAYTPQQNGIAKRKNRTIMNMVRNMLSEKKMPKTFWTEAVTWSGHVLNQSLTLVVRNKMPEEAWNEVKPSVKITISRDVVFEEDKGWDWDNKYEEVILCDLDWGDKDVEAVAEEENETRHKSDRNTDTAEEDNISSDSMAEENYEIGEGLFEGNTEVNLAMSAVGDDDPTHFDAAVKIEKWRKAIDVEMEVIKGNDTWELMELPDSAKKVGVKWVYKTKFKENGEVDKYKARLVMKRYAQEYRVDYTEVFALVACMETICLVVALAAQKGWTIYQLDVKSTFLHGELNETVYVDQPCGYVQKGDEHKVYKLKKILYELKQASCAWYSHIEAYFLNEGFEKCDYEHTLFVKKEKEDKILIVSLYVDDLIFIGNDELMFAKFKSSMKHEFDMIDLGKMRYFLGLEVLQQSDDIFLCQKKYALEMLQRFGMDRSNFVHNPIVPGVKLTKDESGVKVDKTYYK